MDEELFRSFYPEEDDDAGIKAIKGIMVAILFSAFALLIGCIAYVAFF